MTIDTFEPEALRVWLEEHGIRSSQFAETLGVSRVTVYRWLSGDRPPEVPVSLICLGMDRGGKPEQWDAERLRAWMGEQYDQTSLGEEVRVHRTTIGRWLSGASEIPVWVPILLHPFTDFDGRARRRPTLARAS